MSCAYDTPDSVQRGFRTFSPDELERCEVLLDEAAVIIDAYAKNADDDVKAVVSCRMVRRAMGDGSPSALAMPLGATQGSMSALGYTQSWTMAGGTGELYVSRVEKMMLRAGNSIGSYSPVEELVR